MHDSQRPRCNWAQGVAPLYVKYHDEEWGVPSHAAHHLFEMLCLEGAQAGLSWWTVLQKREHYRELFHHFDPMTVARMSDAQLERILTNPQIIRHRGKVFAIRNNAQAWLKLEADCGDPVRWLWGFVDGQPLIRKPQNESQMLTQSAQSVALSKELKQRGFSFVGPTIIYSFMQAVGMINDHAAWCFRAP